MTSPDAVSGNERSRMSIIWSGRTSVRSGHASRRGKPSASFRKSKQRQPVARLLCLRAVCTLLGFWASRGGRVGKGAIVRRRYSSWPRLARFSRRLTPLAFRFRSHAIRAAIGRSYSILSGAVSCNRHGAPKDTLPMVLLINLSKQAPLGASRAISDARSGAPSICRLLAISQLKAEKKSLLLASIFGACRRPAVSHARSIGREY